MTIIASTEYRANFDTCVTLYKDLLKQSDNRPELKFSALNTRKKAGGYNNGGTYGGIGKGGDVQDSYDKKLE